MNASALGQHANFRLADGRVIAPTEADRRRLARVVLDAAAEFQLLAFCAPDTHLHIVTVGSRAQGGEIVRRIKIGLRRALDLPAPFSEGFYQTVERQGHLERAVEYVLGQQRHHGTAHDPTHDASSLPDLVGMRLLGRRTLQSLRAFAPRLTPSRLARHLGIARFADGYDLRDLAGAAMSAACLTSLAGRSADAAAARRAAVHLAGMRHGTTPLAHALGIGENTVRDLRKAPPPPVELVRAIALQLRFRQALRQAPGPAAQPEGRH